MLVKTVIKANTNTSTQTEPKPMPRCDEYMIYPLLLLLVEIKLFSN